uniref:Ig-like domain-containing protein n=1 Tax=Amphilophus citrinellus TaxID=61819 RepID=A0A3Q0SHP0_AMPCI
MIRRLISLILLSALPLIEMNEVLHQIPLTVAKIGDDVTLTCSFFSDDAGLSYWYKLNFGYMLETVARGAFGKISLMEQFDNSRFSATNIGKVYYLTIRNISKEDEATYLCQAGSAYIMEFINCTVLAVNGKKSVTVKQIPDTEMVQLGGTMTLQCSLLSKSKNDTNECLSGNKVHWFRAGSESYPHTIYHGSIRNTEEGKCVYSLSKSITNSSDAGMYYCAVVTCGEILFGEGTKVEISMYLELYQNIFLSFFPLKNSMKKHIV